MSWLPGLFSGRPLHRKRSPSPASRGGCVATQCSGLPAGEDLIHHRLTAAVPLPLEGKACTIACQSAFPFGEGGRRPDEVSSASPHSLHPSMPPQRTTHGRPQSAKVRCLCLAAQHKHHRARLCNTVYPACDGEPGGPGGPITLLSPPGGLFSPLFARTKSGASHSTHKHMSPAAGGYQRRATGTAKEAARSASPHRGKAARSASPAGESRAQRKPRREKPRAAQLPRAAARPSLKTAHRAVFRALRPPQGEAARSAKNRPHIGGTVFLSAGDGNRTHVASLEGWNSTIELHPQRGEGKDVRAKRLELIRRAAPDPKSGASAIPPRPQKRRLTHWRFELQTP